MAGLMKRRKVDEMSWTWAVEYLVGPGVILMRLGAAVLPWLLLKFDEDHAIFPLFDKNVSKLA